MNRRMGKNAILSAFVRNATPSIAFWNAYPNDYCVRQTNFVVQRLHTRPNGTKVLSVVHAQFPGQEFELLPTQCRLERAGPPNQYFAPEEDNEEEEQLVEVPGVVRNPPGQLAEEPEDDVEPVDDGKQNEPPPPPKSQMGVAGLYRFNGI